MKPQEFIRDKALEPLAGCGLSKIKEMREQGEFPRPVKINDAGTAHATCSEEIALWQQYRIAKRDGLTTAKNWLEYRDAYRLAQSAAVIHAP